MPAGIKGRDVLVKMNTSGSTFTTVGAAREATMTINNEKVDMTSADSGGIQAILEGAGVSSCQIKLSGVYIDHPTHAALRAAAVTNVHKKFQFVIPKSPSGVYTVEGNFMLPSWEEAGNYKDVPTYSLTLDSDGPYTIT